MSLGSALVPAQWSHSCHFRLSSPSLPVTQNSTSLGQIDPNQNDPLTSSPGAEVSFLHRGTYCQQTNGVLISISLSGQGHYRVIGNSDPDYFE